MLLLLGTHCPSSPARYGRKKPFLPHPSLPHREPGWDPQPHWDRAKVAPGHGAAELLGRTRAPWGPGQHVLPCDDWVCTKVLMRRSVAWV